MVREWYRAYLAALVAGHRRRALAVVSEARAGGIALQTLYLNVFQRALREVGRLWQENEMTIAQEHLATAITEIAMAKLQSESAGDTPQGDLTVLAACADSEMHAVGLRMVCDLRDGSRATANGRCALGIHVPVRRANPHDDRGRSSCRR